MSWGIFLFYLTEYYLVFKEREIRINLGRVRGK